MKTRTDGSEYPRSPLEELGGYPWLPRLIDKVRGFRSGRLEDYTPFPSGIDGEFVRLLGVEADSLRAVIESEATDAEVVGWVVAHQAAGAPERIEAFWRAITRPCPAEYAAELTEEVADRAASYPDLDFGGVTNFVHVICIEEGHAWPGP